MNNRLNGGPAWLAIAASCSLGAAGMAAIAPPVRVYGAMRNFMRAGDLSSRVRFDTLERRHLYALGVGENLHGEILVLNGRAARTTVRPGAAGQTATDTLWRGQAALLVGSTVRAWRPAPVPARVASAADLENFVAESAVRQGLDTAQALAFRLVGRPAYVGWHVMEWPAGAGAHTHANHHRYAVRGKFRQAPVEMLGFFSRHHQTVFTHHSTFLHVHVQPQGQPFAAHVDSLSLAGARGLVLYLPQAR